MADDQINGEPSITIKALLLCADDHLDVDDQERGDRAHDYVLEAWQIVLEQFPQYAEKPSFELMKKILRRLIERDGLWIDRRR